MPKTNGYYLTSALIITVGISICSYAIYKQINTRVKYNQKQQHQVAPLPFQWHLETADWNDTSTHREQARETLRYIDNLFFRIQMEKCEPQKKEYLGLLTKAEAELLSARLAALYNLQALYHHIERETE